MVSRPSGRNVALGLGIVAGIVLLVAVFAGGAAGQSTNCMYDEDGCTDAGSSSSESNYCSSNHVDESVCDGDSDGRYEEEIDRAAETCAKGAIGGAIIGKTPQSAAAGCVVSVGVEAGWELAT